MTTEPTLRLDVVDLFHGFREGGPDGPYSADNAVDRIADLLSATGAPAYIRVADDLRGVVREEGDLTGNFQTDSLQEACRWAEIEATAITRYLEQQEEDK